MSVIRNSGSTKMLHSCELYRSALTSQCVKSFDLIETQQLRRCYTIDATAAASATTTIAIHLLLMLVYSDVVAGLCQTSNLTPQIPCFSTLFDIYIYIFFFPQSPALSSSYTIWLCRPSIIYATIHLHSKWWLCRLSGFDTASGSLKLSAGPRQVLFCLRDHGPMSLL